MASPYPVPKPVPPPNPQKVATGVTLLSPQSRKGSGPGIIVLPPADAKGVRLEDGIPSPLLKWAEEGYCVAEVMKEAWDHSESPLNVAADALKAAAANDSKEVLGLVCYDQTLWELIEQNLGALPITAAVLYTNASQVSDRTASWTPILQHICHGEPAKFAQTNQYHYPSEKSYLFATPFTPDFNYATEAVSHTRNLSFLKKHMHGPSFDLEALWEEHTSYEFANRSVENTMNTMVQEPYVNHVPTLTGGIGRKELSEFYRDHFIFSNPADTELELISRTVGIDRVVDEFIFKCTHDSRIDWLLPGISPTGRYIEVPMMAVVNIRGDRLYHEHIHWDSASALKQVGLMSEHAFVPETSAQNGTNGTNGAQYPPQLRLPVYGKESAAKMRNKNSVPSNEVFGWNK